VATGFRLVDGQLNADSVILVTRFEYTLLIYSLTWYVSIVIASLTLFISIIVDNTATAIGVLMAALIGGQFLQFFLSDWPIVKFFFVTNLDLTRYLTGSYQPINFFSISISPYFIFNFKSFTHFLVGCTIDMGMFLTVRPQLPTI